MVEGKVNFKKLWSGKRLLLRLNCAAIIMVTLGLMITTAQAGAHGASSSVDDSTALQVSISYLKEQSPIWGIQDTANEFRLRQVIRDSMGNIHVRLDQVYKDVPVFGQQLVVHLNSDRTPRSVTGTYRAGITVSTQPKFTAQEAHEKAKKLFPSPLTGTAASQLVLYTLNGDTVLVHRVVLEDDTPRKIVAFIDATTGGLVYSYNDLPTPVSQTQDKSQIQQPISGPESRPALGTASSSIGTGNSLYSGTVNITTNQESPTLFSLLDSSRGGLSTNDMKNRGGSKGIIFTDMDNIWGNSLNTDRATAGVDAHFGAEMTWDYYLNNHSRIGIYNDGKGTLSKVHYRRNYNNAFWSDLCKCMTYGDGDGTLFTPLVSLDVIGHEMTHGVTSATAGLIYDKEPGGLNEAMSDIFGTMVEYYASAHGANKTPNYLLGEDIFTPATSGDALRYMNNPTQDGRSIDTYADYTDVVNVHYSSGIANNAFYLLAEGGIHRLGGEVTGIGRDRAEKIFYLALTGYMIPSETFSQARADTIQAAEILYGAGSQEVISVGQAWSAVGVV